MAAQNRFLPCFSRVWRSASRWRATSSAARSSLMLLVASLKRRRLLRLVSWSLMLSMPTRSGSMSTTASEPSRGRRGWFRRSPTSWPRCRNDVDNRPDERCRRGARTLTCAQGAPRYRANQQVWAQLGLDRPFWAPMYDKTVMVSRSVSLDWQMSPADAVADAGLHGFLVVGEHVDIVAREAEGLARVEVELRSAFAVAPGESWELVASGPVPLGSVQVSFSQRSPA